MRFFRGLCLTLGLCALASCESDKLICCSALKPTLRIVNAFTSPVDVLIDGQVTISGLAVGAVDSTAPTNGDHAIQLRPATGTATNVNVTTATGATKTIAAIRASSGAVSSVALDDTNAIVPAGATKVRVLHLAPNAGTLQVYRTQLDFPTPTQWQFPFNYQTDVSSAAAPFYQSTVGTWEVRVWQTPADASGWATATVKAVIPLASGEKKTVVILDKTGGGVRIELF
jgi:hypothetical protein